MSPRRTPERDDTNPLLKWLIIGVVAVVVVGVGVGFLANRDAQERSVTDVPQVADVSIEGAALPEFDGVEPDPAMERIAPAFAATTFDGVEVSVLPGDGTAKIIGFFAHWCPHCQRELPRIVEWFSQNQLPDGVEVIAVSTAVDAGASNYPPSAWFERELWPAAKAVAVRDSETSEIAAAYGLRGFPYTVVLDADGKVKMRVAGEMSEELWEFAVQLVTPDPS